MKYTVTIRKEVEDGFIDPCQVCDYEDFDDVRESGSPESFIMKVKGQLRFREVALRLAGLTSWDDCEISHTGGSALTAPDSVEFVFYKGEYNETPISEEVIKEAVAFALTHSYEAPMDVWHPQTKTEPSGKVLMPLGFMTEIVRAESLYNNEEQAKSVVSIVVE